MDSASCTIAHPSNVPVMPKRPVEPVSVTGHRTWLQNMLAGLTKQRGAAQHVGFDRVVAVAAAIENSEPKRKDQDLSSLAEGKGP